MNELDEYIANKFTHKIIPNEDNSFLEQWQLWLNTLSPREIINTRIAPSHPVNFSGEILINIHPSIAGKIPVIVFSEASDFEAFITNSIHKGTPPDGLQNMGASFIYGKRQRFLALSRKYYSNVSPQDAGFPPEVWREKSMIIRREHELTHYYTKKFYGTASNNLHDELIADFFGIYEALGHYDAKLFTLFMRNRLGLYTQGLSPDTREAISQIAAQCAASLELWQNSPSFHEMTRISRTDYLCALGIQGIIHLSMN